MLGSGPKTVNILAMINDIKKDVKSLRKRTCLQDLLTYHPRAWIQNRPKSVQAFAKLLCGVKSHAAATLQTTKMAMLIENLYGIHGRCLVLPLSFLINLVITKLSKCKLTSNILGRLSPGGTYQHIFNWVKEVTESPLLTVPSGDVKYMFDNSQKIGKT